MSEDSIKLFEGIAGKILEQVESFRVRSVLPDKSPFKWAFSGDKRYELLVKPRPACPWCKERVTVEQVWLVDKEKRSIHKAWSFSTGKLITDYSKLHPHVYDHGGICMGNSRDAVQALLEGMNPSSVLHDMSTWLAKWGHPEDSCEWRVNERAAREERARKAAEAEAERTRRLREKIAKVGSGEWDWGCTLPQCPEGGIGGTDGEEWTVFADRVNPDTGMYGSYRLCQTHASVYAVKCGTCNGNYDIRSGRVKSVANSEQAGDYICMQCLEDKSYFYCAMCWDLYVDEDAASTVDGESYCGNCEDLVSCCSCGDSVRYSYEGGDDNQYCEDCYNDHWGTCNSCDRVVRQSDLDDGYCPDCIEDEVEEEEEELEL